MTTPRDPAHYLTELRTTTIPRRLLWLDCAAAPTKQQGISVDRWRCGVVGRTWFTSRKGVQKDELDVCYEASQLWRLADAFCKPNKRTVLWAYDLAYQLRVSEGLVHLPLLGWHLDKIVLERSAAWALFKDDDRTLLMCDIKSWCPVDWGKIASDVRGFRGEWSGVTAGEKYHSDKCAMRVGVLREAVLQILQWVDTENLGPFRPTGSGQSYAAYRRRFLTHQPLVHDDAERLQAERSAMWTGRCEAWRHGPLTGGPYVEYDMTAAYCRIAAECDVPTVAQGYTRTRRPSDLVAMSDEWSILAHITVDTDIPVLPTKLAGRTLWPVGMFSTWVWDPELRLAMSYCNSVKVHRAYKYKKQPALRHFARFVLDGLGPQTSIYGPIPQRVMKHWSRCLVGRLGLRYRAWVPFGVAPTQDLRLVTYIDCDEGVSTDMLIAGHDMFILDEMSESPDSLPQVPSWVMSECRRRLWEVMINVGLSHVVYIDTDSIICDASRDNGGQLDTAVTASGVFSRKGTYQRITIHGPRNYQTSNERHISGLPKTARQVAPLEFTGQVMRSIKESMRSGELDCVATLPRRFVMDAPDMRREHLPNHRTAPFAVQLQ